MKEVLELIDDALQTRRQLGLSIGDKLATADLAAISPNSEKELEAYRALGTPEQLQQALNDASAFVDTATAEKKRLDKLVEDYQKSALTAIDMPRITDEEKTELSKSVSIVRDIKDKLNIDGDLTEHLAKQEEKVAKMERDLELHVQASELLESLLKLHRKQGIKVSRNTLFEVVELSLNHVIDSTDSLSTVYGSKYNSDIIEQEVD